MGAGLLLGLAIFNDKLTRVLLEPAQNAVVESNAFSSSMARGADTVRAMGMSEALTRRWLAARNRFLSKQARAGDVTGGVTAAIRFFRQFLQGLLLAVGAWLAVDHIILPATIFAASIIMSRALAPMEQAVTAWRHSGAAGQAAYRLRRLLHEHPRPAMRSMLPDPTGALTLEKVVYAPRHRNERFSKEFHSHLPRANRSASSVGAGQEKRRWRAWSPAPYRPAQDILSLADTTSRIGVEKTLAATLAISRTMRVCFRALSVTTLRASRTLQTKRFWRQPNVRAYMTWSSRFETDTTRCCRRAAENSPAVSGNELALRGRCLDLHVSWF